MALETQTPPGISEIHLWQIDASVLPAAPALSRPEAERAERRLGAARVEFIAAHDGLRRIIASYLDCEPQGVALRCDPGEPPHLASGAIELSLSHRDGVALVAVARAAVGVDIERADSIPEDEVGDLAEFILDDAERAELGSFAAAEQPRQLARLFARKEAAMKALGLGLGDVSLRDVAVGDGSLLPGGRALTVRDLDLRDGFVGAVATSAQAPQFRLRSEVSL